MSKTTKVFFLVFLIVLYFVFFNLISLINFSQVNESLNPVESSTTEQAAFGDSVRVTTYRDKMFWDVYSYHHKSYTTTTVHFLGFIPLPLKIHNFNFFYIHLVDGIIFMILFLSIIFSNERRYYS